MGPLSFFRNANLHPVSAGVGMPSILVLSQGLQALISDKRQRLLEGAGYFVVQAHGEEDALKIITLMHCNAVVLCHTVSETTQDSVTAALRMRQPGIAIVRLSERQTRPDALLDFMHRVLYGQEVRAL